MELGRQALVVGLFFGVLLWPLLALCVRRLRRAWIWFVGVALLHGVTSSLILWLVLQAPADGGPQALILFGPVNLFFLLFHGLVAAFVWQESSP